MPEVREQEVVIPAPDGMNIYTTVGFPDGHSLGTVVLIHGLACSEIWPTILLGSWYFRKAGFTYCRINLYDWRPGARTLMTTDLVQHAQDVETVVHYLREQTSATPFFAVGHSFGAFSLLYNSTLGLRAQSLWDASSFISHPSSRTYKKDVKTGATYYPTPCELLISERFEHGAYNFPDELSLARKAESPTQVCYAAGPKGVLIESSKRYFEHLPVEKELCAIEGASHSFTEEGKGDVLFEKTVEWFKKFL